MPDFSFRELTGKDKKKMISGSVIPRPIALVSTISDEGVVNIAPFSYFNIVSNSPAILSVAVQRAGGGHKDTARNILEHKEAVVHTVDTDNIEMVNQTSAVLPPEESELEISGFTAVGSKTIHPPGLYEAKIRFETALHDSVVIYDEDDQPVTDLLLLKVKHVHLDEDVYDDEKGYILAEELEPVSRLAGNDYAGPGSIFTVERPE